MTNMSGLSDFTTQGQKIHLSVLIAEPQIFVETEKDRIEENAQVQLCHKNAKMTQQGNVKMPKCHNAKMPKCQNAQMPKKINEKLINATKTSNDKTENDIRMKFQNFK